MKFFVSCLLACITSATGFAQDSIRYRVIFMADEGKPTPDLPKMLQHAAGNILGKRTAVFYLDDNKYLQGKAKAGNKEERAATGMIRSQYETMKAKGANVFFISAIDDRKYELDNAENISRTELEADSFLASVAGNNCPDPVEINLTDSLTVITFNSEWWLYPFDNADIDDKCECKTRLDVLARLDALRYKNRNKIILLASHHPFQSYGVDGNKGSLKDHLFPLTAASKNLYVPLPVIGSFYRFFRSSFVSPGNSKHPLYKGMISSVDEILQNSPNLVHVSGHEKGLQLIKDKYVQVVSGPGASHAGVKKGKHALFASEDAGYVIADLLHDYSLRFSFFTYDGKMQQAYTWSLPYTPVVEEDTLSHQYIAGDSVTIRVHPSYEKVGKFHRLLFGENYRKEWAAPTRLPVFRLSKIEGGLTPLQRGGGMQSKSLRLADKDGKEWVIRSVEKSPDALLPDNFRQTFVRGWLDDATSAQHPFSALIVPPVANAVNIPHAKPVIGIVAPDKNLGIHERVFSNMVVLLEEREPLGDSDNSEKMKKNLQNDNDNSILAKEFLKARMLDMFLGDWDRHEDQWRWKDIAKGKTKTYQGVPRDRDQVFHLTQGFFPKIASRDYVLPTLRDFDPAIKHVKWVLFKTRFVNAYPAFQLNHDEWMTEANKFKQAITDSVLETSLKQLPRSAYELRHHELLKKLKSRRDKIPDAMNRYYRFIQKTADIQTSDKNEWVQITGESNGGLNIRISKISKNGAIEDELMNKTYDPLLTKEVRLYLRNGQDSVIVNNTTSPVKLRIIGGHDRKAYDFISTRGKVKLYDRPNGSVFYGNSRRIKKHISNDSLNTVFVPVNLYNVWMPLLLAGLNIDDGFIIGAGFKFIKQEGFRKLPYASMHQLLVGYAFSTGAYRIKYNGEWIYTFGKTDITLQALAKAPNNTLNFFGRGNQTPFNKIGDYKRYYRTRFSTYQLDPALRWRTRNSAFSIGPSLYYYRYDKDDNKGRFITNTSQIGSYDSSTVEKSKWHLGGALQYVRDTRNNKVFPQWGSFVNVRLQAYKGMGEYAKSFAQLIPELAFYKSLTRRSTIILAERLGGVVGMGKAAFYQSAFIGGHENLLGYKQYRFAGQHSIYNNLELRIKLADVASYIVPGQFGITGFWDIGRVWEKSDNSGKWHNGTGGGIYFAPASVIAFNFVVGYSKEGWYPYFTMGLRF